MGYFSQHDKDIVKGLAREYLEVAMSPANLRSAELAYNANDRKGGRPFVAIDELPWVELNGDPELNVVCEDSFARGMENFFRRELYRFRHFPTNRLFFPYYRIGKSYDETGWGIGEDAEIIETEKGNNIVSHRYRDLLEDENDIEKMQPITITPRPDKDEQKLERASELIGNIMDIRLTGTACVYLAPWDSIVRYHTVENTFYDLYDRPEFMHAVMQRFVDIQTDRLEQMERYGLFDSVSALDSLHCTAPFTSSLPADKPGEKYLMKDIWIRNTAQTLGSCSPEMYDEFEIRHMEPLSKRFGALYYGCCEPLEKVIPYLKRLKNLRKIGVSPFADVRSCAEQIRGDYTLSRKPNPSYLSGGFSEEVIRKELTETVELCEQYGCSYDYVLKDISTVGHEPERLSVWARTVSGVLDSYYGA